MFEGFDLSGCERLEIVSTLMGGKPSCVVEAVVRVHHSDDRPPRDVTVPYGETGPIRETLDAQIAVVNAVLSGRPRFTWE